MKKYLISLVSLFCITNVFADMVFEDYKIIVKEGTTISGNITTKDNGITYLYNSGCISGTINTNGENLIVYNKGDMSGAEIVPGIGAVEQRITSEDEITRINVIGNKYDVIIEGVQNIDFDKIKDINANSITFNNSSIIVNNVEDLQNWKQNIILEDMFKIKIKNIDSDNLDIDFDNVISGKSNLSVDVEPIDNMYAVLEENKKGNIHISTERVTDYNLVNKSEKNKKDDDVLEQIRQENHDDKLIDALDKSKDDSEFNNIKNHSYRYNHGILLRPIKMITNFEINEDIVEDNGVGLNPFYVFSDTIKDFGGNLYAAYNYKDLYLNFGFNFNSFSYEDNLNDFSGNSYGINIKAKQKIDNLWIAGNAGFMLTKYSADYIESNKTMKKDPFGNSEYGKVSIGYDFNVVTDLIVSPFVGGEYQRYDVADVLDRDLYINAGGKIKYNFITDGIKYEYSAAASVTQTGNMFADIKIGFVSVTDGAGASIGAELFKNDFDSYYKLSLNAQILF
nr:autotransporter domain-containing protein [Candidatus Enterousia merdequi]